MSESKQAPDQTSFPRLLDAANAILAKLINAGIHKPSLVYGGNEQNYPLGEDGDLWYPDVWELYQAEEAARKDLAKYEAADDLVEACRAYNEGRIAKCPERESENDTRNQREQALNLCRRLPDGVLEAVATIVETANKSGHEEWEAFAEEEVFVDDAQATLDALAAEFRGMKKR